MRAKAFFDYIRENLFKGVLSNPQVNGINDILLECANQKVQDYRVIAYILATSFHETGKAMQPVREAGMGKGYDYGKKLKRGGGAGKRIPYVTPDKIYYGRGDVQLTWYENYQYFGKLLFLPLLENPDLMLVSTTSKKVLVYGIIHGSFTGLKAATFINEEKTDWVGARKIINGTDKADLIASYASTFHKAMILI